ncbi:MULTISPECIES: hypothetical protein [Sorangium]|uniref:Uncharacterized protein n=1 Tax=Sorangium cellulosum TaxID=56 RepID=A0A4P2QY72_SORCE|nr:MULTISPECIES: hypothetical protein [Sorangium]AUX34503.1 uncharacterized protein SOCE836_066770 [Sorangium cellulosum]WCQ93818.1 hypothetical protein NQZ70_06574 [Sorangium sp. Soce836]
MEMMERIEEASCDPCTSCSSDTEEERGRPEHVERALRLGYLTVGWNVAEGVVAANPVERQDGRWR